MKKLHIHLADIGGAVEIATVKHHDHKTIEKNAYELAKYLANNANGKFMEEFLKYYFADLYGDHHTNILPTIGAELERFLHHAIGPEVYKHLLRAMEARVKENENT